MKKTLLIVAMLLLVATPVMATTTVKVLVNPADQFLADGNRVQPVSIAYVTDVNVRAFALDINIDSDGNSPNFQYIRNFKTGESTAASPGYGIFPSRFRDFIVVTGPNWVDTNYNPTPAWNEPETVSPRTGLGFPKMIIEMGALYAGDANKPAWSGTLFKFDVNAWGKTGTFRVTVAANTLRGGVVNGDGNSIVSPDLVLEGNDVYFAPLCTTPSNQVGNGKTAAEAAWTTEGFTNLQGTAVTGCPADKILTNDQNCIAKSDALKYTYSVAPAEPNVAGMTRSAAVTALTNLGFVVNGTDVNVPPTATYPTYRTVRGQNPPAGTTGCGTTVQLSVVSQPVKGTAGSLYTNWVGRNRPACWAYPRQCRGDADGAKLGFYWVSSNDLTMLRASLNKTEAQLNAMTNGYCPSATHLKLGFYWVSSNDLGIVRTYLNKTEVNVPLCGNVPPTGSTDPNYWYWCLPASGACPSGQNCAPAGICPNTP